jgi:hypothetical protein
VAVGERHTVEIRTASEVREGDEILGRRFKPVRIGKAEQYPGMVILYRREGPPRHVLQQIGQFAHSDPVAVVVGSSAGPTEAEVEHGARVLSQEAQATGDQGDWNPWDTLDHAEKEELRREARAVLEAAVDGTATMPQEGGPGITEEVGTEEGEPGPPDEVQTEEGKPELPQEGGPPMPQQGPPPVPQEGGSPVPQQGPPPVPQEGQHPVPQQGPPPVPQQGPPPVPQQGQHPVPQQGPPPATEEG